MLVPWTNSSVSFQVPTSLSCPTSVQTANTRPVFYLSIQPRRKRSILPLIVPSLTPRRGAQRLVGEVKLQCAVLSAMNSFYTGDVEIFTMYLAPWYPDLSRRTFAYLATRLEVLAFGIDALVVVDVILPAVLCLVLVGKAGVEACRTRSAGPARHTISCAKCSR